MKPAEFLPPAAALVAAGLWLGSQHHSLSELADGNALLQENLGAVDRAEAAADSSGHPERAGHAAAKRGQKVDWKQLALKRMAARGDVTEMRTSIEIQKILMGMSAEEILSALDEIASMDIPAAAKWQMEAAMIGQLSQDHPELVMERFGDRIGEDRMQWQLSGAFQSWARKDPASAAAWMEQQIGTGKFESKTLDGQSDPRIRFEAVLAASLMDSDPAAAASRLMKLSEEERSRIFTQGFYFQIRPGMEKAAGDLVRSTMPEDRQAAALAAAGSNLVRQGGYGRVGTFIDSIGASDSEREAIVSSTLQNNSRGSGEEWKKNFEEGRAWAEKTAPEAAGRLTGRALGVTNRNFGDAAAMALEYHQESGNDEVLVEFLKNSNPAQSPDLARQVAEKISDEATRAEILKTLEGRTNPSAQPAR